MLLDPLSVQHKPFDVPLIGTRPKKAWFAVFLYALVEGTDGGHKRLGAKAGG